MPYEGKVKKPEYNPSLTKPGHTYTFKHWQLKDAMGNVYKEVQEFDFANTKITKPTTLVAYFEENVQTAKYTIKHVFKGIQGEIEDQIKTVTKNALTNSSVQLTNADKYHDYQENGFEMQLPPSAEIIKADGSTEFTITYVRREFDVTFNVNFKNQFTGEIKNIPSTQKVKFEGKAKKPQNNPTIDKHGRTYLFKHWQLESSMNGVYSEQQPYDFAKPVLGNVSLVAYFKETIEKVTYKVVHYLEKQGKEANLNGHYDKIEEIKTDQKVEDGAVYSDYAQLDTDLYENTQHIL